MPLPEFIKALAEKKFGEFCERRVSPHIRHKVNLSYTIRGNSITIVENRVPWLAGTKWTHSPIAQCRYDDKKGTWTLYWRDRNRRWWKYEPLSPMRDIDKLLDEIDKDPTHIFWG